MIYNFNMIDMITTNSILSPQNKQRTIHYCLNLCKFLQFNSIFKFSMIICIELYITNSNQFEVLL